MSFVYLHFEYMVAMYCLMQLEHYSQVVYPVPLIKPKQIYNAKNRD